MRRFMKYILAGLVVLLAIGLGFFFFVLPGRVEQAMNGVSNPPPYAASDRARALHETLTVADLHADPLLWGRDLLARGTRGQVDIPRLDEGNVALQVFAVVSKSPRGLNIEHNDGSTDNVTLLAIGQRWPISAIFSLKQRALYQAARLNDMAVRSDGHFVIIRSKRDLRRFLDRRKVESGLVAGVLAIEGAQVLEGDPANVDVLFDAGFRMMSPAHFFDSEMGGSAHGVDKGGLTDKGREMVRRMEEKGMILDLAHASSATIDDALAISTRPVVVSHTGVKGTCDNNRNLSDEQLKALAARGGLIGIGYWETAVCGKDATAIAKAIQHTVGVAGIDHVALGSDFDGAVTMPFDTTGLVQITDALLAAGFSDPDTGKVMGGNEIRFLLENLPN
ncbi:MAG TPA: membrane dipeptidase [Mesorhizobium sp.]|uniref:dipeptidase n=1 Tax=Mesorhizobium sp. TaxID=1871066 RepID=UPI002DDD3D68|nr:membrane dipeptidase [Mesorhizobium sp.]HEV2502395.1 membrane dipeptidase [Mesorhizobium sp.]